MDLVSCWLPSREVNTGMLSAIFAFLASERANFAGILNCVNLAYFSSLPVSVLLFVKDAMLIAIFASTASSPVLITGTLYCTLLPLLMFSPFLMRLFLTSTKLFAIFAGENNRAVILLPYWFDASLLFGVPVRFVKIDFFLYLMSPKSCTKGSEKWQKQTKREQIFGNQKLQKTWNYFFNLNLYTISLQLQPTRAYFGRQWHQLLLIKAPFTRYRFHFISDWFPIYTRTHQSDMLHTVFAFSNENALKVAWNQSDIV